MLKFMRLLHPYFRPYQNLFWLGFIFLLIGNGLTYLIPYGIRVIWDQVFPQVREAGGIAQLVGWCGLLVLVAGARAAILYGYIYFFWLSSAQFMNDLRNRLYHKLQRLPFSFYDKSRVGDLMSRLTLDLEMVRNFYAFIFEHRAQILIYLPVVTVLLLLTDWQLALGCLLLTPLALLVVLRIGPRIRQAVDQRQIQAGKLNSLVQENIVGIRVVKAFGMEAAEVEQFRQSNREMLEKNLAVSMQQAILHPFLVFCSAFGTVTILGYGGYRVIHGQLTLGTLMQFISYLALLAWPMSMFAPNMNQLRQAQGSAGRLLAIMNEPEQITSPEDGGQKPATLFGKLVFEGVNFGYQADNLIIKNLNLTINPGEKVAVVGLTGSGKSTLINLVPRFYDPVSGAIKVDGTDLRSLNLDWWRSQVGLVLQETFLFSATIRDNIAFGKPEVSQAEVELAARRAQIHDFIASLPEGYETVVGERGVGLSGGQKQRIAIARALLTNPKILILDDFTSSVDPETELAIENSLQELMEGRTTILITQRLSTAQRAQRIIILESGNVRAQGNHSQLLESDDFYRQLYTIQLYRAAEIPASGAHEEWSNGYER